MGISIGSVKMGSSFAAFLRSKTASCWQKFMEEHAPVMWPPEHWQERHSSKDSTDLLPWLMQNIWSRLAMPASSMPRTSINWLKHCRPSRCPGRSWSGGLTSSGHSRKQSEATCISLSPSTSSKSGRRWSLCDQSQRKKPSNSFKGLCAASVYLTALSPTTTHNSQAAHSPPTVKS